MVKKEEQAKVETDEGLNESEVEQPEVEAEPEIVMPEAVEDEGKEVSEETWEQKFKTLGGMPNKQFIQNLFEGVLTEVRGISSQVKQQGETLEILSDSADLSEEAEEKRREKREAQEKQRKATQEAQQTMTSITRYAEAAGLTLEDEALKPAKEAWTSGKPKEALELTVIACIGGKKKPEEPSRTPAEKEPKEKETKPNLKVLAKPSAPGKSTEDMTSHEKIIAGAEEARRKQD